MCEYKFAKENSETQKLELEVSVVAISDERNWSWALLCPPCDQ